MTADADRGRERDDERDERDDDRPGRGDASDGDKAKDDGDDGKKDGEDRDDGPPLYKKPLFWIIGGIVLLVLIVGGILYWLHARQYESTDDAFVDAHLVRVAPEVAGKLVMVANADNRHVHAGDVLAIIDPSATESQLAEQKANLAQAAASLAQAQAQIRQAQAQRAQAAANTIGPRADADRAQRDLARYLALRQIDSAAAAATQVDQAQANAASTAGAADAARRQVDSADAQIAVSRRQADAARAQILVAQARIDQANVTVGYLRLKASVDGQIVNRSVNLGSYVSPGQQIMALVPDVMWVTANFKETQLRGIRVGQHVDIKVDAFPDIHFDGHIDSIQRGAGQAFTILPAQNATGNYVKVVQRVPVRILFDRPDPRRYAIGPGMSVVPRVKVR